MSVPLSTIRAGFVALLLAAMGLGGAWAQTSEQGPAWSDLSASQRSALAPLGREWREVGPNQKEQWLEIASRFPTMTPDERSRVQEIGRAHV